MSLNKSMCTIMVKHSYSLISLYNLSKTNLLFVYEGTVDSISWKPLDTHLEGHAPQTAVHSQVKKATVGLIFPMIASHLLLGLSDQQNQTGFFGV